MRAASGAVEITTVAAKIVMSRPTCDSETASSVAISGNNPVGNHSLVTEVKISAERVKRPAHGNACDEGEDGEVRGVLMFD